MSFLKKFLFVFSVIITTNPCLAESFDAFKAHYNYDLYLSKPARRHISAYNLVAAMKNTLEEHMGKTDAEKLSSRLESDPGTALTDLELQERADHLTELIERLKNTWQIQDPGEEPA